MIEIVYADVCDWTPEPSDIPESLFNTDCGESGVHKEDDYKFCPYCGAEIRLSDNGGDSHG